MPTVLVGESDRELNGELCSAMQHNKYKYVSAFTGEEVVYFMNRSLSGASDPISLVLMDANIRGLSGYAAMGRMATMPGITGTPIVLTLESYLKDMLEEGFELGVFGFILKPLNVRKTAVTIKAIIEGDTAKLRKASHSHSQASSLITKADLKSV